MTKHLLLAAATLVAAPALAQETVAPGQTMTQPAQTAPDAATSTPTASAPAQTAPVQSAAPSASAPAQTAQQPAASGDQVATVVDQEFPSYDKDSNGQLSKAEFGDWMVKLRTVSDPSTKVDAPSTKTWVNAAFAQADSDKSSSLTKTELTGFLAQGQS